MSLDLGNYFESNPFQTPDTIGDSVYQPPSQYTDNPGTSVPTEVSTGSSNVASVLDGIFTPVLRTGASLLDAWGKVQTIKASSNAMSAQQQIQTAQIGSATARAKSDAEIAKITAEGAVDVARAQAQAATARAQNEAAAAKKGDTIVLPGTTQSIPTSVIFGVLGLGLTFILSRRKKG